MQEGIAVHARHAAVHFRDHVTRGPGSVQRAIHSDPETHVSVLVGRGQLHEDHIERYFSGTKQLLDFAQHYWGVVGAPGAYRLANVGPHEKRIVAEVAVVLRERVVRLAESEQVEDFNVMQGGGSLP